MSYQKIIKDAKSMAVNFVCGAACGLVVVALFGVLISFLAG